MTERFLDYSQYKTFQTCEYMWWERYRSQVKKAPYTGQKDDALTLGTLVHAGLESLRLSGRPTISEEVIGKAEPTPECLAWAQQLVLGYQQAYPNESFTRYYCEEPLRFPLHPMMDGLAKVDSYFVLSEPTTIQSNLTSEFTLEPGIWVHEYKTKASSKNTGNYVESWRTNLQPSFQMLALAAKLGETPKGVLVNVLEKPADYKPRRTCKGCKQQFELREWVPTGEGYRCPACDNLQELDTSDKSRAKRVANYYRIMVVRPLAELERDKREIYDVAERMLRLDANATMTGEPQVIRATERCVDHIWGRCEYFEPHAAFSQAASWPGFVPVHALEYVGETKE